MQEIDVRAIASFLGVEYIGTNFQVNGVCSATQPKDFRVSFINHNFDEAVQWNSKTLYLVNKLPNETGLASFVVVDNPRFSFARVSAFLTPQANPKGVHELSSVGLGAVIGENVSIGPFTVIEDGAIIGDNVVIENNVTIRSCVDVGNQSRIKSNSVLGTDGFGFEMSESGVPTRIHHFGGVKIGEDVEIGCNSVICRGTIDDTVISNNVKIDDHVFIAHNVFIGQRSMIIAGSEISGSVRVGNDCWIAPQVTILNKVSVGDGAFIGIGAVVNKNVEPGVVVVGNPAKFLRKR
jgi:UDP-3-O-[3-hydroxymyristoyl] glucosamine N-acyltransferase LpxD